MTGCVALVGCGRWGKKHLEVLRNLRSSGSVKRLVVCDTNPSVLVNLAVDATYTSLDAMLARETLHAAAVVTPPNTHLAVMDAIVEHDVPVLVEKPLGADHAAVERTLDGLSPTTTLFVGYLLRHHRSVQHLHHAVVSGSLGRLTAFEYRRTTVRPPPSGADALSTLAVHGLDLLVLMAGDGLMNGEVETFLAEPTRASMVIRMSNGVCGTVEVAWGAEEERRLVAVEGELGRGEVDFGTGETRIVANGTPSISPAPLRSALEQEWVTFLATVEGGDALVFPEAAILRDQASWLGSHGAFNGVDNDLHGCEN